LDAFWAAFRIPDTLFQLVAAGAVGSALVPVASALLANGEDRRARRVVATVANLMLIVLMPLAVVVWFAAPAIVPDNRTHPPDASSLALEIELTRWMLLSPILLAIAAVMTAGLNASGIFGCPALAPNVYNIAIIVCAVALTPVMGINALALGVVSGAAGHVATRPLPSARTGSTLSWSTSTTRRCARRCC
jgi:putative peptidoglycan lipid II flippase